MTSWNPDLRASEILRPLGDCPWCRSCGWMVVPTTPGYYAARCSSCGAQAPEARSPSLAVEAIWVTVRAWDPLQPPIEYTFGEARYARDENCKIHDLKLEPDQPMFESSVVRDLYPEQKRHERMREALDSRLPGP